MLFYTSYFDNHIGQIEPGSAAPDRLVNLGPMGVARSVGGLTFVPEGLPGAGRLKFVSNTLGDRWYDAAVTPDGTGTYNIVRNSSVAIPLSDTPTGIVYVPPGSPLFPVATVLIVQFEEARVTAYPINCNGDPIVSCKGDPVLGPSRTFLRGLTGLLGAGIDPLTGDFLFSTFGSGNLIVRVSAVPEPDTWTLFAVGLGILVAAGRRLSADAAAGPPGGRAASPPAPVAAARSDT